jgi:hypothetical protein
MIVVDAPFGGASVVGGADHDSIRAPRDPLIPR